MNPFIFKFLLVVATLVCTVQSSYKDPPGPILAPTPDAEPQRYGNHIEQMCGVDFRGGWNYEGTCVFPSSVDQCTDGVGVRTKNWSRRPCPINSNEGEAQRRYLCCIRQACGFNLAGRCQNVYKNCPGMWEVAALDGTPINNRCPIQDEFFVACCVPYPSNSKNEGSITKSSSLLPSLCSATNEKACGLRDESQIPMSLDRQRSGASLGTEPQVGHGSQNNPLLDRPAIGNPQRKEQSYLDNDQNFIQPFSGDIPATNAQIATTDSHEYDGWEGMPPLTNTASTESNPYLQDSPYAQALAAVAAAAAASPNSNIESSNDFADWTVTT